MADVDTMPPPAAPTTAKENLKPKKPKAPKKEPKKKPKAKAAPKGPIKREAAAPSTLRQLATDFPDKFWSNWRTGCIEKINESHRLELTHTLDHAGMVSCATWNDDCSLLATASSFGGVKVWDPETWQCLVELRDEEETAAEEFYAVRFSPDNRKVAAAGKLKDREEWDENDEDNRCIPGCIKVFDMLTGTVTAKLQGHTEEIFCLRSVTFRNNPYFVSASQDGTVRKWFMTEDYSLLVKMTRFEDEITNMAFDLQFVPGTGNKYMVVAADDGLSLFDFEGAFCLQRFTDLYTSYCDCIRFLPNSLGVSRVTEGEDPQTIPTSSLLLITRGVESVNESDQPLRPNAVHLRALSLPTAAAGQFELHTLRTFSHSDFHANVWPARVACNGGYIVAPTEDGQLFVFNTATGAVTATIETGHGGKNVRDVTFHRSKPYLVTTGDDGTARVLTVQAPQPKQEAQEVQQEEQAQEAPMET